MNGIFRRIAVASLVACVVAPWSAAGWLLAEASGALGQMVVVSVYLLILAPAIGGRVPLLVVAASPMVLVAATSSGVIFGAHFWLEGSLLNASVLSIAWMWVVVSAGLSVDFSNSWSRSQSDQARAFGLILLFFALLLELGASLPILGLISAVAAMGAVYARWWFFASLVCFVMTAWLWHGPTFEIVEGDHGRGVWTALERIAVAAPFALATVVSVAARAVQPTSCSGGEDHGRGAMEATRREDSGADDRRRDGLGR